eukprot:758695-Rhodomonas_salina.2
MTERRERTIATRGQWWARDGGRERAREKKKRKKERKGQTKREREVPPHQRACASLRAPGCTSLYVSSEYHRGCAREGDGPGSS